MELLIVFVLILAFELAAARWGYDSRDDFRGPTDVHFPFD
jgi:hypothetical protein